MWNRNIILLSIIVGSFIGTIGSIYDPSMSVFAQKKPYLDDNTSILIIDRELKHVDRQFESISNQLTGIRVKMDAICDDIVNIRIDAAKSGGIYGGISAGFIYLLGLLGKNLWSKHLKK